KGSNQSHQERAGFLPEDSSRSAGTATEGYRRGVRPLERSAEEGRLPNLPASPRKNNRSETEAGRISQPFHTSLQRTAGPLRGRTDNRRSGQDIFRAHPTAQEDPRQDPRAGKISREASLGRSRL